MCTARTELSSSEKGRKPNTDARARTRIDEPAGYVKENPAITDVMIRRLDRSRTPLKSRVLSKDGSLRVSQG
jgi:hypothetical protein